MVAIGTILLVANLIALIWKGQGFMSFWWVLIAYLIEICFYVLIIVILAIVVHIKR